MSAASFLHGIPSALTPPARPTSFSRLSSYEKQQPENNTHDIPLLPNRLYDPPSPQPSQNWSPPSKHRPSHLSLSSSAAFTRDYGPDDQFDPNALYQPLTNHPGGQFINTPQTDDGFLITPSPSLFPNGLPKPPPCHPLPFAQSFEQPHWRKIALHIFLVALAYPILLIFVIIARDKSLFWSRFVVSIGCGIIGFGLGLSLINLGRPFLEAATWATIIHQSRMNEASGVRLRDLAATSQDPTSAFSALRLLWTRWMYPGTTRRNRKRYDSRPWSLAIAFFLLLVITAAALPFILGRIVSITTNVTHQRVEYYEIPVKGDLSDNDIASGSALQKIFEDEWAITWTLAPFSTHGSLPPAISYPWEGDMVYFSEAISSQFVEGGSGFGTFEEETTTPSLDAQDTKEVSLSATVAVDPGSLLRYPRWGIRTHCEKLPDPAVNILPKANGTGYTYMFTPRSTLQSLFSSFNMDLPTLWESPLNASVAMQGTDTLPSDINVDDMSLSAYFYDNGVAHSMKSWPLTMGQEGFGWVSVEAVMVRLNTTYAPNGTFGTYSDEIILDVNAQETRIGYDAAVCLELFEAYILETYNSTVGLPSTVGIIGRNATVMNAPTEDGALEKKKGSSLPDGVKTQLNSTGLAGVYTVVHGNSVNQLIKDNGRDAFYVPSPTVVSYTGSTGPYGYAELNADYFAQARTLADASNILPYFAGSADTLARMYPDRVLASTSIHTVYMVALIITVLGLGIIAGLFVPKLPYGLPHRGFEVYSWLAAFHGDELVGTYATTVGMPRNMPLKDIEEKMGDLKFRYGF
ncbi:hypothetical protein CPB85DRAFT_881024 [Mucidula mucida]|nr:hypothetical protein CPB85DRAFT_881024 [Mucidula mucida]